MMQSRVMTVQLKSGTTDDAIRVYTEMVAPACKQLQAAVFVCGGRYDGIAPTSNLEAIQRQIPDARLELFEGGLLFLVRDPQAYSRILAFSGSELD